MFEFLEQLKNYLADRPEVAFLALTVVGIVYLFKKYDKAKDQHLTTLSKVAPLADKLCMVIGNVKRQSESLDSEDDNE